VNGRLAAVAATLTLAAAAQTAAAQTGAPPATLVMPFENEGTAPHLIWLSEGSSWLLAESLSRYGAMPVSRDERVSAFERLQLPPAAALSHATMIKVAQFVGASDVLVGAYRVSGEALTITVRSIGVDEGRLKPEVVEQGPLTDLFGIYDRAARRLTGALAAAPPPAPGTLLASPQAFEAFIKGLVAESPATQRTFLEQAAKAAASDDRVRLALWQVHTDLGDHLRALDAVGAVTPTSLHARSARYLSALSQIDLKRYDEAFGTLKTLQDQGRSAEVLNAMGVVQLRRGGIPPSGRATYFFSQASQSDTTDADYFFNLGYAYWIEKDPPAAMYWLREAVRRDPADGDAHFVLAAALQQSGATAEAARERELASRLSSRYEAMTRVASADPVPRGLERLKDHLEPAGAAVATLINASGQRDQAQVAAFHLEAGRRAFAREADTEAERELRRVLYLSPYESEAHLLLGRIHLRSGRTADAIQAFKIALWSQDSAAGHLALAEAYLKMQNRALAKEEVDRALALDPGSAAARALAEKLGPGKPRR
jgi:tetratricopeptide (TPR) repeat protein